MDDWFCFPDLVHNFGRSGNEGVSLVLNALPYVFVTGFEISAGFDLRRRTGFQRLVHCWFLRRLCCGDFLNAWRWSGFALNLRKLNLLRIEFRCSAFGSRGFRLLCASF